MFAYFKNQTLELESDRNLSVDPKVILDHWRFFCQRVQLSSYIILFVYSM